jgi:hypothetical protein
MGLLLPVSVDSTANVLALTGSVCSASQLQLKEPDGSGKREPSDEVLNSQVLLMASPRFSARGKAAAGRACGRRITEAPDF